MKLKVIGVGDNVVDKYHNMRLMYPGGNAFNFAVYAGMLGVESAYLGVFGTDESAAVVKNAAKACGVSLSHCVTREGENGYASVDIVQGDRIFRNSNKGGVAGEQPMVLTEKEITYLREFQLICTSINSRMPDEVSKLYQTGVPVAFDFSVRWSDENLRRFCPFAEYAILSCGDVSMEEMNARIASAHAFGSPYVIATRGAGGSWFSDARRRRMLHHAAHMVDAKDALGAGDAYLTAFLIHFAPWERLHSGAEEAAWREAVDTAMEAGAQFAAKICMLDGAFGHAAPLKK